MEPQPWTGHSRATPAGPSARLAQRIWSSRISSSARSGTLSLPTTYEPARLTGAEWPLRLTVKQSMSDPDNSYEKYESGVWLREEALNQHRSPSPVVATQSVIFRPDT